VLRVRLPGSSSKRKAWRTGITLRRHSSPPRGHRHCAFAQRAIRGVRVDAVRIGPLGELHAHERTHVRWPLGGHLGDAPSP
jgi:hypothetical protein